MCCPNFRYVISIAIGIILVLNVSFQDDHESLLDEARPGEVPETTSSTVSTTSTSNTSLRSLRPNETPWAHLAASASSPSTSGLLNHRSIICVTVVC